MAPGSRRSRAEAIFTSEAGGHLPPTAPTASPRHLPPSPHELPSGTPQRASHHVCHYTKWSVVVAPRRRRTGYRPGEQLPDELAAAIAAHAETLAAIHDPLATIEAVGATWAALDDALAVISLPRLRAVARLRSEGWSYDRIAAATSLSKPRVAQLAREARERGL